MDVLNGYGRLLRQMLAFVVLLAALWPGGATATDLERQVKAAYLLKFAHYVDWPDGAFATPDSAIVFGIIGDRPLGDALSALVAGKQLDGRPLHVRQLGPDDPLDGLHLLFVGPLDRDDLNATLDAARTRPLLTVSDARDGRIAGAMVNFVIVDQRLRFEIALDAIRDSTIHVSALMMTAAHRVIRKRS